MSENQQQPPAASSATGSSNPFTETLERFRKYHSASAPESLGLDRLEVGEVPPINVGINGDHLLFKTNSTNPKTHTMSN